MKNAPKLLSELTSSYLFKDIFMYEEIRSPEMLENILKALAHQVGSLVSYNEIANLLKVSSKTVERYVKLLEQSFVIFRLPSYARNIRNELSKSQKIYFYDNGIRNALIGNFDSLAKRTDIRQLWENYLVGERKKFLNNNDLNRSLYFWRTKQQQEIDLIELDKDEMLAFEFKWQKALKSKIPTTFTGAYPNHTFKAIDKENYWEFVM
jgi:predicted AAA+ superfamily ATPase